MPFDVVAGGNVIGVVNDFNFLSLHEEIQALAICIFPSEFRYLYIKLKPDNIEGTISFIKDKWENFVPGQAFKYSFLDQNLKYQYQSEIRTRTIFNIISFAILLLACLGIFGISTLTTSNRTQEICIRKVNGAKSISIVLMIMKEFTIWVFLAFIAAFPIAYYFMDHWLKNFTYRISAVWEYIVVAGILTLLLVLVTISWQTIKAAKKNPQEILRYE